LIRPYSILDISSRLPNPTFCERFQVSDVAIDKSKLLIVRPTLNLTLACNGVAFGAMPFLINQSDGPAARCPKRAATIVVDFYSIFDV